MTVLFKALLYNEQSLDCGWLSGMPEALGLNPSTRKNEEVEGGGRKGQERRGLGQ